MSKKRLYVDVHCLQTLPPSCVNRDDTGAPKTAVYGGVTRARVSSQAWKKAVRDSFHETLGAEDLGYRTKHIVQLVKEAILDVNPDLKEDKAEKMAADALTKAGLKIKNANVGTDALMLISRKQAEKLAELAVSEEADKNQYKKALQEYPSVDMALFGRMVASDPSLNYDAACQVAHAISTHAVANEFDYFTAVDDLNPEDNAGAAHIGVGEFNSSTMYRYATVNVQELYKNLGLEAPEAVTEFIDAFVKSMPTGKLNSFANNSLPSSIYIAVREDQPVSLAAAFEKPVPSTENGYEQESQRRLVEKAKSLYSSLIDEPFKAYVSGDGLNELAESQLFSQVLKSLQAELTELLTAEVE